MTAAHILNSACVISVSGKDALGVVNNLATNDIRTLPDAGARETFLTNLRGWVVAHLTACWTGNELLLCGQHTQPEKVVEHIDRYVIREDVQLQDLSPTIDLIALRGGSLSDLLPELGATGGATAIQLGGSTGRHLPVSLAGGDDLLACDRQDTASVMKWLDAQGVVAGDPSELEVARIMRGWPLDGQEILEKTLPQELDRDAQAINFSKGCYLGQETIARLDARGQLQKKLCILRCQSGAAPTRGTPILAGEKEVGSVTSAALVGAQSYALGFLKRGFFDAGNQVRIVDTEAEIVSALA